MKKISLKLSAVALSLVLSTAHAGFLKSAVIAGAGTYAGHAVAKKIEASQEAKKAPENKVKTVNKDVPK